MTEPAAPQNKPVADASIFGPHKLTQLLVAIATGISCALFWLVARLLHVPREPGFGPSLSQSPQGWMHVGAAVLLLLGCWWIGDRIAGRRWPLAGLFAAVVGLAVWSGRSGTMQELLFHAQNIGAGAGVFPHLLLELLVLFVPIVALWQIMWLRESRQKPAAKSKEEKDAGHEGRSDLAAIVAQVGVTLLIVYVALMETSAKKQVMTSVFLATLVGASVAEWFFATRDSWRWYWIAPLAAGVAGYVVAWHQPTGIEIGHLSGTFVPFSRALPLDYAAMGCAGALAGYWLNAPEATAVSSHPAEPNQGSSRSDRPIIA